MSSNLQEITLMSRNLCASVQGHLDTAAVELAAAPFYGERGHRLMKCLTTVKSEIDTMADMVDYFNFYSVDGRSDD